MAEPCITVRLYERRRRPQPSGRLRLWPLAPFAITGLAWTLLVLAVKGCT